jgi:hypothetical protein
MLEIHEFYSPLASPSLRWKIKHMGEIKSVKFQSENQKGRKHLKELRVDGRTMLRCTVSETGCVGVHWIHLAQGWNPRLALMNTVTDLRGSIKEWNFFTSEGGLRYVELVKHTRTVDEVSSKS